MSGADRVEVTAELAGERLDVVLSTMLGESRSQAAARLERGEVTSAADGRVLAKSYRPEAGETVLVAPPPTTPTGAAGTPPPPVRYEDDHLMVVDKPAGVVVHPGTGNPAGTMVQALAAAGYRLAAAGGEDRPGIVHRLDRDTSGLLVVAKTDEAYYGLVRSLKAREVDRRYVALVEGAFEADTVRIEVPIGRDPTDRKRFAAMPDGKRAATSVEQLRTAAVDDRRVALLGCRLETGRTHQIRVHLSYARHPVVGDATYGADAAFAARLGLQRLFLHAASLGFRHPVSGDRIAVDSTLPSDLATVLEGLGLPAG